MINTDGNGVGSGGTATPAYDKQLVGAPKKTALRDVQNQNVGPFHKQQESLLLGGGRSSGDTIKVCGTKRLTPERPSSSKGLPSLAYNGANENVMNARRRFDLELGRGRLQNNVEKNSNYSELKVINQLHEELGQKINHATDSNIRSMPIAASNNPVVTMAFASSDTSVPSCFGKLGSGTPVTKVSLELPHAVDAKCTKDHIRTEHYIRLQKFLKQCDEADRREYTQMLLCSSSTELSNHAVELEKRAIQLTIEEGNEMQRMKMLNILLTKSSPANNMLQSTQLLQSNK